MITKIAWRNVWRNKLRSSVVITSISLGIWATLFIIALSLGLNNQRTRSVINSTIAHVQLHPTDYTTNESISNSIAAVESVRKVLENDTTIAAFTIRAKTNAMASTGKAASGVQLIAVNPSTEPLVSSIPSTVKEGEYLDGTKKNELFIGKKLADKLGANIRSKVILTFQDSSGNIVAGAFRVKGIFKSSNSMFDESTLYVNQKDFNRILGNTNYTHEIALLTNTLMQADSTAAYLQTEFPDLKVESWKDIAPELAYADEMMAVSLYLILGIVLLALAFGILNAMLMAVLERKRELGMLLSVGMNKRKVFTMIVAETIFIGLLGGPIGTLLSFLSIEYFKAKGIDLSLWAQGLESLGIDTMIYPELLTSFYLSVPILVVITTLVSAIYPAIKALSLNPSQAVRAI